MSDLVLALKATAEGGVRKCEPFVELTDCVNCAAVAKHGFKSRRRWYWPSFKKVEDGFVPRTCNACGFRWRQFA